MTYNEFNIAFARFQFKMDPKTRQKLWRKLSKMLRDGIQILSALEEIRRLSKPKSPLAIAIGEWTWGIQGGRQLSEVVQPWVSAEESMLLVAGEQSGTLSNAMDSVVRVSKAKAEIKSAIVNGTIYPLFLMIMAFGLLYMFGNKIVPSFTKAARSDSWHGVARIMIDVAWFIEHYLHWVGLLITTAVIAFFVSLPTWNSKFRVILDRMPPYSIYRIMQGSSWLIALSALVQAGVRVELAIEQLRANSSAWAAARMDSALRGIRSGRNLGQALDEGGYEFPDREIIGDLSLYASKSGFDEALRIIGDEWITESVISIKERMAVIFVLSIVVVGLIFVFSVSGLMAMMLQLNDILKRPGR